MVCLTQQTAGHRSRLRSRVLPEPELAPAYEILELLLGYVYRRKDTKPLARELLRRFGGISGVLDAHPAELLDVEGVGESLETFRILFREVMSRYLEEKIKQKPGVLPDDLASLARCRLNPFSEEVWAALLDNGNRLLTFTRIRSGSVNQVLALPRDVAEIALRHKAAGLILVHNHPGGGEPSLPDKEATHCLRQALAAVGLRLVDHLVLADGKCYSIGQHAEEIHNE